MKRLFICIISLLACTIFASAQHHILSFGLRGGTVNLFEKSAQDASGKFGPIGAFDITYDYYVGEPDAVGWGLRIGLGIGYARNLFSGNYTQQYVNTDYLGNEMDYSVSGSFQTKVHGCFMDVPILATMRVRGFYLGAGLKTQSYIYSKFKQSLGTTNIEATYPEYGPTVSNELITGYIPKDQNGVVANEDFLRLNISAGLETGYEWHLKSKTYIALTAYVYCSVWDSYSSDHESPVVKVAPITNSVNPVPEVRVNDAISSLASRMTPLEFGLKLAFGRIFE